MKKILITGISGFVGGHYTHFLTERNEDIEIYGISRSQPAWNFGKSYSGLPQRVHFSQADMRDKPRIQSLIRDISPDYILHLAAQSSVAESWKTPEPSLFNNISSFMNVIETVRIFDLPARILSVGSAEQYGVIAETDLPLTEDTCMHPLNPYAVARVAQEQLAKTYADGYGLDILCTRSFNHFGPGQSDRFVVSSIVKQCARIAHGMQENILHIGNDSIIRDFLDVRDVVAAYDIILKKGLRGETYNVCSGKGYAIRDIVKIMAGMINIRVSISQEKTHLRPLDNPQIIGSFEKMNRDLGWQPTISLDDSLRDTFDYWDTFLSHELKR